MAYNFYLSADELREGQLVTYRPATFRNPLRRGSEGNVRKGFSDGAIRWSNDVLTYGIAARVSKADHDGYITVQIEEDGVHFVVDLGELAPPLDHRLPVGTHLNPAAAAEALSETLA